MNSRTAIVLLFYTSIVLGLLCLFLLIASEKAAYTVLPLSNQFKVHVIEDDEISVIANHLYAHNCIHHPYWLMLVYMASSSCPSKRLLPGMYVLEPGLDYAGLVKILYSGDSYGLA